MFFTVNPRPPLGRLVGPECKIFLRMIQEMAKNILTAASRKRLKSRKRLTPFRRDSRVINQFKPDYWDIFCQWAYKQQDRKLLILEKDLTPKDVTFLRFNFRAYARHNKGVYTKTDVCLALAELINAVGGTSGMKQNLMVFYRYITSPEHTNLCVDYTAMKRYISRRFSIDKSGDK